jgi:diguanylate cyclase (GGDEF)-like protein
MDELTQLSNHRGFEALSRHVLDICRQLEKPASLLFFDLQHFRHINEHGGRAEGDRVLNRFARLLKQAIRDADVLGRIGGDEFAILLANAGRRESNAVLHRFLQTVEQYNRTENPGYDIVFSVGVVEFDAAHHAGIADLLSKAGTLMYTQKQQRRKRNRTGPASCSSGRRIGENPIFRSRR